MLNAQSRVTKSSMPNRLLNHSIVMRISFTMLLASLLAGCSSAPPRAAAGVPQTTETAMKQLYVGMGEHQALEVMKPVSLDWGRLPYGGSGAGQLFFQVSNTQQIKLGVEPVEGTTYFRDFRVVDGMVFGQSYSPGLGLVVRSIGNLEPKTAWKLDSDHNFVK